MLAITKASYHHHACRQGSLCESFCLQTGRALLQAHPCLQLKRSIMSPGPVGGGHARPFASLLLGTSTLRSALLDRSSRSCNPMSSLPAVLRSCSVWPCRFQACYLHLLFSHRVNHWCRDAQFLCGRALCQGLIAGGFSSFSGTPTGAARLNFFVPEPCQELDL